MNDQRSPVMPIPAPAHGRLSVPRTAIVDVELPEPPGAANPFDREATATLRGPDGEIMTVPAFYDSRLGYRARVSFPRPGAWTVQTYDEAGVALTDEPLRVDVDAAGSDRGGLQIDPAYRRHFAWADGTPFFFRGYEANWLLMLDQHDDELTRLDAFTDSILEAGFTAVTVNAYAHSFRQYVPADLEHDPRWVVPSIAPWIGGNGNPDYGRLDPDFFAHMDRAVAYLHGRGLVTHLMIHVYNKDVNWPEPASPDDDRYWRQIVARYQAYGSIIWDTAKESYHRPAGYIWTRLATIRKYDGYRRLVTAHDTNPPPNVTWGRQYLHPDNELVEALTDVTSDQILQDIHADACEHHRRTSKPYINIEFGYESGLEDLPSDDPDHDQSWEEVTRRMWHIVLGGGYPNYYYRNTAWSLFVPFPTPPGYRAVRHLADFWDALEHRRLTPVSGVATAAVPVMVRADIGREYVVLTDEAVPVTLDLPEGAQLHATWFSPLSGERHDAGPADGGSAQFSPPSDWTLSVLHLR
ncbi:DUF4038 domain-containing protein [Bogoriella caseilytica]|uniref:Uncharacterized protein DUF5060 n=1 Tax=Bogoriella caseilytica TaxID=56055 RepID=A0A3N2BDX5_9MICO|nr:DUF4038 domain-containing protein [Bogoriella caseilytica]ROR73452.1 uncharacterized protein DUF5060 [Bogoriella caseilytica]